MKILAARDGGGKTERAEEEQQSGGRGGGDDENDVLYVSFLDNTRTGSCTSQHQKRSNCRSRSFCFCCFDIAWGPGWLLLCFILPPRQLAIQHSVFAATERRALWPGGRPQLRESPASTNSLAAYLARRHIVLLSILSQFPQWPSSRLPTKKFDQQLKCRGQTLDWVPTHIVVVLLELTRTLEDY